MRRAIVGPMWPRQTLFTDERMGDQLWPALSRLPRGSGVLFRHKSLSPGERDALARAVARTCFRRGLRLAVSGDASLARRVDADMVHKPEGPTRGLPFSLPVHDEAEAWAARRQGAALVYVSPIFSTRSHPETPALGPEAALHLAQLAGAPAIALGGMDAGRFAMLNRSRFIGWAAIDAFLRD